MENATANVNTATVGNSFEEGGSQIIFAHAVEGGIAVDKVIDIPNGRINDAVMAEVAETIGEENPAEVTTAEVELSGIPAEEFATAAAEITAELIAKDEEDFTTEIKPELAFDIDGDVITNILKGFAPLSAIPLYGASGQKVDVTLNIRADDDSLQFEMIHGTSCTLKYTLANNAENGVKVTSHGTAIINSHSVGILAKSFNGVARYHFNYNAEEGKLFIADSANESRFTVPANEGIRGFHEDEEDGLMPAESMAILSQEDLKAMLQKTLWVTGDDRTREICQIVNFTASAGSLTAQATNCAQLIAATTREAQATEGFNCNIYANFLQKAVKPLLHKGEVKIAYTTPHYATLSFGNWGVELSCVAMKYPALSTAAFHNAPIAKFSARELHAAAKLCLPVAKNGTKDGLPIRLHVDCDAHNGTITAGASVEDSGFASARIPIRNVTVDSEKAFFATVHVNANALAKIAKIAAEVDSEIEIHFTKSACTITGKSFTAFTAYHRDCDNVVDTEAVAIAG